MRIASFLALGVLAFGAGCGGNGAGDGSTNSVPNTNASSSGGSVLTAPVDYLGAIARAQQSAVKSVGIANVNQAIKQFQTELGRLPKDLNELVQEKYLPRIPPTPYGTKLVYDPATGEAKVVNE
jgi:hypothetical protein